MVQEADLIRLRLQLHQVFTPQAPINEKDSFQGRHAEIRKVLEAMLHTGEHVVIFGERGVGKTSLAGLIEQFWVERHKDKNILVGRVNCDPKDDYISIWAHIAEDLRKRMTSEQETYSPEFTDYMMNMVLGEVDSSIVRHAFESYGEAVIIILDEFDRIEDEVTLSRFADTVKGLSDYAVDTTLVIVGVADTIGQLIGEHASVDRCLAQILLPRLASDDICSIISTRYDAIGLAYEPSIIEFIYKFTHGFPHYAHLIGQSTGLAAVEAGRNSVSHSDVYQGLEIATENVQESVKRSYYEAVSSSRPNTIHREVLLACSVAEVDEIGYFSAGDIREPLSDFLGTKVTVSRYLRYLSEFASDVRGNILQQTGTPRKRRYRFTDPLVETFVYVKGWEEGFLVSSDLSDSEE